MTITRLDPDDIPLVSIGFMNRTHQEEVGLVTSLMKEIKARLSGRQNDKEISQQLGNWFEHSQAHFARENELMQETGFPAFPVHSKEHEIVLDQMQTEIENWRENRDIERLQNYVFTLWPDWFLAHIGTMDRVTADYARMNNYTEK